MDQEKRHLHICEVFDTYRFRVHETEHEPTPSLYPQGRCIAKFGSREDAEAFVKAITGGTKCP